MITIFDETLTRIRINKNMWTKSFDRTFSTIDLSSLCGYLKAEMDVEIVKFKRLKSYKDILNQQHMLLIFKEL